MFEMPFENFNFTRCSRRQVTLGLLRSRSEAFQILSFADGRRKGEVPEAQPIALVSNRALANRTGQGEARPGFVRAEEDVVDHGGGERKWVAFCALIHCR